jgi:hypothetical protein
MRAASSCFRQGRLGDDPVAAGPASQRTREREKGVRLLWLDWAALWAAVAVAQLGRPKRGVCAGLRERRGKECRQAGRWMGQ